MYRKNALQCRKFAGYGPHNRLYEVGGASCFPASCIVVTLPLTAEAYVCRSRKMRFIAFGSRCEMLNPSASNNYHGADSDPGNCRFPVVG